LRRGKEKLLKDTIEEERTLVLEIVRRLGLRLSGLMFVCGLVVSAFGIYLLAVPPDPFLSARLEAIFYSALGFIGALNISCGLLLLLGED